MENSNDVEISILKGDKLFNKNTPFVINLTTPQPDEDDKKCNADLICVIDISGSMCGVKISQVRETLKILVQLMDEKDRICLILFDNKAEIFCNLDYLTKAHKKALINKIDTIDSRGGTNILSGLTKAIDVLKSIKNSKDSVSSVLLLSDGCDNYSTDIQLADSLKNLTKGLGLSFTLNTFGYGDDHDAKLMNKLANIRDGSFFYIQDYSKITEYFVSILGGCMSVISKKVDLNLQVLNNNCQITKVYGEDKLFYHESNPKFFNATMLQFICGKEYTFVLELFVDESKIKIGEEIMKVVIKYEDISHNNEKRQIEKIYKYELKDLKYSKANEEYTRVYVYDILDVALKKRDYGLKKEGKKLLEDLEKWLQSNFKGDNREYINDVRKAKGLFSDDEFVRLQSYNCVSCTVQEKSFKRTGNTMMNCNSIQNKMINSINSVPKSFPMAFNNNRNNLQQNHYNQNNQYYPNLQNIQNIPVSYQKPVIMNMNKNKYIVKPNQMINKKEPIDTNYHSNRNWNPNPNILDNNTYNRKRVDNKNAINTNTYKTYNSKRNDKQNNINRPQSNIMFPTEKKLNQTVFKNNNNVKNTEKIPMDNIKGRSQNHVFVSSKINIENSIKSLDDQSKLNFFNKYNNSKENNK
jgi:Mg-chelatase subunit ChlD